MPLLLRSVDQRQHRCQQARHGTSDAGDSFSRGLRRRRGSSTTAFQWPAIEALVLNNTYEVLSVPCVPGQLNGWYDRD